MTVLLAGNRPRAGAIVAFLACLFHMGLAWFVFIVILACCLFRFLSVRGALLATGAAFIGMAARPHPVGAFRILFAQIPLLVLRKAAWERSLQPLELMAMSPNLFLAQFWPFLFALSLMAAGGLLCQTEQAKRPRRQALLLLALTIFSIVLTIGFARRAYDLMALFGGLFISVSVTSLKKSGKRWCRLLLILFFFLCLPMGAHSLLAERGAMRRSTDPYRYRAAADWLSRNAEAGEIVYHVSWGTFPDLLAWNRENRYVAGVDPVFLYAYDPKLYYEYLHLRFSRDAAHTCPTPQCEESNVEETRDVLSTHFHAAYLLVETKRHPLYRYATGNPGFRLVFETTEQALFRLVTSEEKAVSPVLNAPPSGSATIDP